MVLLLVSIKYELKLVIKEENSTSYFLSYTMHKFSFEEGYGCSVNLIGVLIAHKFILEWANIKIKVQ